MADSAKLKERAKILFQVTGNALKESIDMAASADAPAFATQRHFSAFDPDDQERQAQLLFEVFEAFRQPKDANDGLEAAIEILEDRAQSGDLLMVRHVLGIFSAHAPKVRDNTTTVPVPPLVFAANAEEASAAEIAASDTFAMDEPALSGEALLHWFREDIHLNEHHRHWHMVYATSGIPSGPPEAPRFPVRMKARQGEVFIYMHKQMLARYETERLAAGLPPVVPFDDFEASLGDGYRPNAREPRSLGYVGRVDGSRISRAAQIDLENRREAFRVFLQTGRIAGVDIPINAATVGTALESNRALISTTFENADEYTRASNLVRRLHLHNVGHGAIAGAGEDGFGVMTNPHTSLKDPVFWRWHKMIDDLAETYYENLLPYDFRDSNVTISAGASDGSGIAIFSDTETDAVDFGLADRDELRLQVQNAAEDAFGTGGNGASVLRTGPRRERYKYLGRFHGQDVPDRTFERETLFCERFAIALRVTSTQALDATARIFISADRFLDLDDTLPDPQRRSIRAREHRYWIEIDRQPVALEAGEQTLTFLADESSIVRKLRGRAIWPTSAITEAEFDELHNDAPGDRDDYCDCGWPINLLLPKGLTGGMPFQMMAMVSPGAPSVGAGACGSRSFCGTDFEGYPELDDINLGFPFDRPGPRGTLPLIAASPNMAMRAFSIEHTEDLWARIHPGV